MDLQLDKITNLVNVFTEAFALKKRPLKAFTSSVEPYIEMLSILFPKQAAFLDTIYDYPTVKERFQAMIHFLETEVLGWSLEVSIDGILNSKYGEVSKILYALRQITTSLFETPEYKEKLDEDRRRKEEAAGMVKMSDGSGESGEMKKSKRRGLSRGGSSKKGLKNKGREEELVKEKLRRSQRLFVHQNKDPVIERDERLLQYDTAQEQRLTKQRKQSQKRDTQTFDKHSRTLQRKTRQMVQKHNIQIDRIKSAFNQQKLIHSKEITNLHLSKKRLASKLEKQRIRDLERSTKEMKKKMDEMARNRIESMQNRFEQEIILLKQQELQERTGLEHKLTYQKEATAIMQKELKSRMQNYTDLMTGKLQEERGKLRLLMEENNDFENRIRQMYRKY